MTLDEIFYKEFVKMSKERAAITGSLNLGQLPVPHEYTGKQYIGKKIIIRGIRDTYFSGLNKAVCTVLKRQKVGRRKFGANGEFLRDKNTQAFIYEDVPVTQGCIVCMSTVNIKVPLKHTPDDSFQYIDYKDTELNGKKVRYYFYIIPKKYCYEVNQTALVLSLTKLTKFYFGEKLVLQNGHTVYIYVVPIKQTSNDKPYRILKVGVGLNYASDLKNVETFWLSKNILYKAELTALNDTIRGVSNVAYIPMDNPLSDYTAFNPNMSLADDVNDSIFADMV